MLKGFYILDDVYTFLGNCCYQDVQWIYKYMYSSKSYLSSSDKIIRYVYKSLFTLDRKKIKTYIVGRAIIGFQFYYFKVDVDAHQLQVNDLKKTTNIK